MYVRVLRGVMAERATEPETGQNEVVDLNNDARWQARLEPMYVFPVLNVAGELQRFDTRRYDDVVILESRRVD